MLGINLSGVLFTMKHAAAVMKRQGSGRIVVTSSAAGLKPEPAVCYGYAASKAAVLNIVRHAALELAPHGVLVNAICPGPFKGTRIGGGVTESPTPELERMWSKTVPLGRMAEPEELKGLVAPARLAGVELHDRRRLPDRRRHARPGRLMATQGEAIWRPPADWRESTEAGRYLTWLDRGLADYDELHRWSVTDLEGFWASLWD